MGFLDYPLLELGGKTIRLENLVGFVAVMILARIIVYMISKIVSRQLAQQGRTSAGRRHAVYTISKYFIYIFAILIGLQVMGVNITVLVAGSTALFVGLGLGLQDTFKDIVGGVILLFEGTLSLGDVVEVNDMIGRVGRIGLRTSTIQTRNDTSIIVPNNKLVSENLINWSHQKSNSRMRIAVQVAFGSDTKLAAELLTQCAAAHPDVAKDPSPRVFFQNFGPYAYEFLLLFWTDKAFEAEQTMSDIRFAIDDVFRKHGIEIPYPVQNINLPKQG